MRRVLLALTAFSLAVMSACKTEPPPPAPCVIATDVWIFFGYKDARPARFVGDRYEEALFTQAVARRCEPGRLDCQFKPVADQPWVFERVLAEGVIQDSKVCTQVVRLHTLHSSAGPDDDNNRTNPFQFWLSSEARLGFEQALKKAKVIFYNGHSRSGGGPDFDPPRLGAGDHVDYAWYKKHQVGLEVMERALRSSTASNQTVGMFSCASEQLFDQRLRAAKKEIQILSSRELLYFSEALKKSLEALSNLLSETQKSVSTPKK